MYKIRPPYILIRLFNSLIWNIPYGKKRLYLTFDDGPIPETTPWILETLRKYNAKATFFCVGENVNRNKDLFSRIVNDGHSVGNHTYNHLKGWSTENDDYFENIEKADKLINSRLLRPPYGKMTIRQKDYLQKKYNIIMWDVLSRDYDCTISKEECFDNVISYARQGSVIVFHDSLKSKNHLMYALPRVLEYYTTRNYKFKAINGELLSKLKSMKKTITNGFDLIKKN